MADSNPREDYERKMRRLIGVAAQTMRSLDQLRTMAEVIAASEASMTDRSSREEVLHVCKTFMLNITDVCNKVLSHYSAMRIATREVVEARGLVSDAEPLAGAGMSPEAAAAMVAVNSGLGTIASKAERVTDTMEVILKDMQDASAHNDAKCTAAHLCDGCEAFAGACATCDACVAACRSAINRAMCATAGLYRLILNKDPGHTVGFCPAEMRSVFTRAASARK